MLPNPSCPAKEGQRAGKKNRRLSICLIVLTNYPKRRSEGKKGIRVASVLFVFYHFCQGEQGGAVFFLSLTLHLMTSSYC